MCEKDEELRKKIIDAEKIPLLPLLLLRRHISPANRSIARTKTRARRWAHRALRSLKEDKKDFY